MKTRVWTPAHRPFIMGGKVNGNISCQVETDLKVTMHGDKDNTKPEVTLLRIVKPGKEYWMEETTRALMGPDIGVLVTDYADANVIVLIQQLTDYHDKIADADHVNEIDFWKLVEK